MTLIIGILTGFVIATVGFILFVLSILHENDNPKLT